MFAEQSLLFIHCIINANIYWLRHFPLDYNIQIKYIDLPYLNNKEADKRQQQNPNKEGLCVCLAFSLVRAF